MSSSKTETPTVSQPPVDAGAATFQIPEEALCRPLLPLAGEGNGNPLQYSCLEKPMDREAWRATVHGVARRQIQPLRYSLLRFSVSLLYVQTVVTDCGIPVEPAPGGTSFLQPFLFPELQSALSAERCGPRHCRRVFRNQSPGAAVLSVLVGHCSLKRGSGAQS